MRKKLLAGAVLAVMAIFAAPVAANAENYVPTGGCSMSPSAIEAGASGTFTCSASTFAANEAVSYTISGENGSTATLTSYRTSGVVRASVSSAKTVKAAAADGGSSLTIQVPQNASGTYTLTAASTTRTVSSNIAVVPADGAAATSTKGDTSTAANGDSGLATTGSQFVFTIAWIGGLIVLLGLALLFFLLYRRRRQAQS